MNDTIHTHFNHSNDHLDSLIPMYYARKCHYLWNLKRRRTNLNILCVDEIFLKTLRTLKAKQYNKTIDEFVVDIVSLHL